MKVLAVALIGVLCLVGSGCYDPATDGYHVVLEDNFDGTALDPSVWGRMPPWTPLPPDDLISVSGGVLTLTDRKSDASTSTPVTTLGPRVSSSPHYPNARTWTSGYFEARMRFSSSTWNWPAFWLFGQSFAQLWPESDPCPTQQSEIDIADNFSGPPADWIYVLHDSVNGSCGVPDSGVGNTVATGQDLTQWHTYAGRWQDGQVCFYLDGVEAQCFTAPSTFGDPMFLILSARDDCISNCSGRQPKQVSLDVDWVKVWQR